MSETIAPAAEAEQMTLPLPGLTAWIEEQRATIDEWNARGDRYDRFVAANDDDTVIAFGALIEDLTVLVDAIEDPSITGLGAFGPRDALTQLRYLRSMNENLVRSGERGIVRLAAGSKRTKIRWGIAAQDTGSAEVYAKVADRTAKELAIATKRDS